MKGFTRDWGGGDVGDRSGKRADGEAGRGNAAEGIEWGRRGLGVAGSGKVEGSTAWQWQSQSQSQGDAEGRNTSAGRGD